jgi:hypothetical protein
MAKTSIKISIPTFHEIAQRLEESGVKLNDADTITLNKDISLERPIDWRLLTVRKDCVTEAIKVYRHPTQDGEYEIADSSHFLNFVEDIYNYVLSEKKPDEKPTTTAAPVNNKGGW